ncbi:MAG: hypothetical protein ABSG62_23690 [Terracidiphilus sp.]|jgi:hypothetical protein
MATMTNAIEIDKFTNHFVVVHPLDDVPEVKVDTENLGPMKMTWSVRISLLSLRAYLVLMMALVFYHVLGMAGLFGHHA